MHSIFKLFSSSKISQRFKYKLRSFVASLFDPRRDDFTQPPDVKQKSRTCHHTREKDIGSPKGSGIPTERTEEVIYATQEILEQDPTTSIRRLSQQVELSVGTCHKLVRKDLHMYPYRVQSVQELQLVDFSRRLQYCQWFLNNIANNNEVLEKIFFTDEAWFHLSGYTNSQNMRNCATEHFHEALEEPLHLEKYVFGQL
ncbi:hypothetical protein TcasGA2_TC011490 [Tribolium castaneum]|uniref:Uncharacterized protein n=1 Tax=Tribolium castaneum TaxID=7070 RepID=D7EK78_TRICA|nr:hypothetical protein TcasGA2_TC011490 [Tribolium castaneum]